MTNDETIILRIWWLETPDGLRWKFTVWPDRHNKVKVECFHQGTVREHMTRTGCPDFGREEWSKLVKDGAFQDGTDVETYNIYHFDNGRYEMGDIIKWKRDRPIKYLSSNSCNYALEA